MSIESAKAYVERMKTDEEFKKKVLAIEDAVKRMQFVKAEGFDFTAEEIKQVVAEIEDEDLAKIAAAGVSQPCWWNRNINDIVTWP